MKALIIQHEKSVPAGTVLDWLNKNHISYHIHFFSNGKLQNDKNDFDLLFICGGEINVDQEDEAPWLIEEKKFIKDAIKENKKIVGLCLGAQLLAESLGGKVFKAPEREIGWHEVNILEINKNIMVFQWHGYQFTPPPGATKIAENKCCPHQGFKYKNHIIAYQFHPEATEQWIIDCAHDPFLPEKSTYVQNKKEICQGLHHQKLMEDWFLKELDSFFKS